jgi:ubiquinone/menaquinone biosynthesis C-methylase UbiE
LKNAKKNIRQFYDKFGWQKTPEGIYKDTQVFGDLRPVTQFYKQKLGLRMKKILRSNGEYFLDAGCGANPKPAFSANNKNHVCVDLSKVGLKEAQSILKKKGIYVMADLTKMPFRDCVFSSTLVAHILYHIPQDQQLSAIQELYRTLKSGSNCVIIYSYSSKLTFSNLISTFVSKMKIFSKLKILMHQSLTDSKPTLPFLYYHAYNYRWFKKSLPHNWNTDIRCWRLIDNSFTKKFVPNNILGKLILTIILCIETNFPHLSVKLSSYPMIIIRK